MSKLKIYNKSIGPNFKPYIIVEACVNHQGNFDVAKRMIYISKKLGADCIKFQHHIVDSEMLKKVPSSKNFDIPLWKVIEKTNFTLQEHLKLKKFCEKIGIHYLCTPFSIDSVNQLNSIGIKAFKVGSGELTNLPMIYHMAKIGKPIILSTGMSLLNEISETVKIIKKFKTPFALMHCVSAYPCPYKIMNLDLINILIEKFKVPVGLSDHTPTVFNALGAVSLGASLIEKHFTFNKNWRGPDHKSSINPEELKTLILGVQANFYARGNKKIIHREEKQIVAWARASVVSVKDLKRGDKLTKDNIVTKRPSPKNNQIAAKFYNSLINRAIKKNIKKNTVLNFSDLK
jgi:N-acetylneuraminate synthase